MKSIIYRSIFLARLAFLGLGALGGDFVLMISTDRKSMGMPLSVLKPSSFESFLIPWTILLTTLGIRPSVIIEVAWGQENKFLCPNKGFEIRSNKVRFNLRHAMSAILYG